MDGKNWKMMEMNDKGTIRAVCISPAKETEKSNIHTAVLKENWGIEGERARRNVASSDQLAELAEGSGIQPAGHLRF